MDEEEEIEGVPAFFHRHPLLFCFLLFLAFTYAFLYPVFAFILASAPVLVLTALLLGLVLLHSVPQDHDPHVYKISHRPPQCQPSTAAIGGSRRHHHRPSDESSDSSSSVDENDHHPPTMSTATSHASFPDTAANSESESTDSEHEEKQHNHQRSEKKDAVRAVAWTADDDKSIENIGSLELEMNATVEKLMSRRRARGHQRPLHHQHHHHHVMDLADDPSKLSIATRKRNPFDLDGPYDEDDNFPDSAPSMLGLRPSRNPFFDDMDDDLHHQAPLQPSHSSSIPGAGAAAAQKNAMLFRRHESFTVGAPYVSDFRPSRFRPYFVTEKMQGQPVTVPEASRKSSSSSTSSSSAGATAYAYAYAYAYASANKEEEAAAEQEALAEAEAAAAMLEEVKPVEYSSRSHEVAAVDVELISDSSDDDMTLPGGHAHKGQQVQVQQQQQQVAEQEQQMKMEQQQQLAEQEQQMKVQQEQQMKVQQEQRMKQQLAEQEQRMKQAAEQEQQMKMQMQQQQQLALSDDDEGDSFEVESITKQVAAAAAGKTKQLETDPPPAPPNKLQSMRRVFSEEDADEPWAAPSGVEETENEGREQDMLSAPAAGAAPPLSAAAKKAIGKSTKYKPPSKKAVLGFFRK